MNSIDGHTKTLPVPTQRLPQPREFVRVAPSSDKPATTQRIPRLATVLWVGCAVIGSIAYALLLLP